MVELSEREIGNFETLLGRIRNRSATSMEYKTFISYLNKFAPYEVLNMLNQLGFKSVEEFNEHLARKETEERVTTGIVAIGIGVLIAMLLLKKK